MGSPIVHKAVRGNHMEGDRTQYVPRHLGPNVFPNLIIFSRLVRLAYKQHLISVKDLTFGYTASYAQLLTDVLHLRNVLVRTLDPAVVERIENQDDVFIHLLGPGGYEFTVGFLALVALGVVAVPLCRYLSTVHSSAKCERLTACVSSRAARTRGSLLREEMPRRGDPDTRE